MFEQVAGLKIRVDSDGITKAESDLRGLEQQGTRTERSTDKLGKGMVGLGRSTTGASRALGSMGPRAANVSYQLQDMVVQAQSGVNAFTILGQQGSQLASAFGPGGAVIGAIVALSSALGGVLFAALSDTNDELDSLEDRIDRVVGKSISVRVREINGFIAEQERGVERLRSNISKIDNLPDYVPTNIYASPDERAAQIAEVERKRAEQRKKQVQELIDAEERLFILREQRRELKADDRGYRSIIQLERQVAQIQQETLSPEDQERARHEKQMNVLEMYYKRRMNDLSGFHAAAEAEKQRHEQAMQDITQDGAEQEAKRKRDKLRQDEAREIIQLERQVAQIKHGALSPEDQERARHEKQMNVLEMYYKRRMNDLSGFHAAAEAEKQRHEQAMQDITQDGVDQQGVILSTQAQTALGATSQLFGNMAALYAEGGKDTFDEYKFFASAQAGIAAALAATQALAVPPPPLGMALATSIGAVAAVQIAKIQSMEYQGRAIGGQVLGGQSYIVGERGPELLTMGGNGHITPNHQLGGSAQPIEITQVFQVSTGVVGTVRAEMMRMAPAIAEMTKNSVQQAINQGGSMARAVGVR